MPQRKFDRIHEINESGAIGSNLTLGRNTFMVPLIMNDDALGDPMSYNANPEHASFTEEDEPNCYPDSEIKNFSLTISAFMLKSLHVTNNIHTFKWQYALIQCAFPEDLDAIDELSGLSLKAILELQKESTDRQSYPLWTGQDAYLSSALSANVPGLTSNQNMETVAWLPEVLSDQLKYGKLKGLLKKCLPLGIRTVTMNMKQNQTKTIHIKFVPSGAKYINPYTGCFLLIHGLEAIASVSMNLDEHQVYPLTETDTSGKLQLVIQCKYHERHPDFHMAKV